ncbi:hypothetical protein CATMIT_01745, partial [Catenibacterium mitsuokai DSM 15897]
DQGPDRRRGRLRRRPHQAGGVVHDGHRPDRGDRHRVLAGLGDRRGRHGQPHPGDGRRDPAGGRRDAAGGASAGPVHRLQPDHQDAGAGLHRPGRRVPDPRRPGHPCAEGLHLRGDGFLGAGRVLEPVGEEARGAAVDRRVSAHIAQRTKAGERSPAFSFVAAAVLRRGRFC